MEKEITSKKWIMMATFVVISLFTILPISLVIIHIKNSYDLKILYLGIPFLAIALIEGVIILVNMCFKLTIFDDKIICKHIFKEKEILYNDMKKISFHDWFLKIKYGNIISGKSIFMSARNDNLIEFIKALNSKLPDGVRKIENI